MLKIPKVSFETIDELSREMEGDKQKVKKALQDMMEEFASEQPALLSLISSASVPMLPIYAACIAWKVIKIECENSELESFMDVKQNAK